MNDRWTHALLLVLILGQMILLSSRPGASGSHLERFFFSLLTPISHGGSSVAELLTTISGAFDSNRVLRADNQSLREDLARMEEEVLRLRGLEEELERLSQLSGYSRPEGGSLYAADVVFIDRSSPLRTLVIYSGYARPQRNQPVLAADQGGGLVGRVITATGHYAKVQLITDRALSVGAMIERTRRKGLVQGFDESTLILDHIPLQEDVEPGDLVATAGNDGVFPRGLPIGRVARVTPGTDGLFHRIVVKPANDLARLDRVYVLTRQILPLNVRETLNREAP